MSFENKPRTRGARPALGHRLAPVDPGRFAPSAEQPVRVRSRRLEQRAEIEPHRHAWAQVAIAVTGVVRVTAGEMTCLVPAWRAVWIPPEVEHVVHVLEAAELRTIYIHQAPGEPGPGGPREQRAEWTRCRVLEVSALLREVVQQIDDDPRDEPSPDRLARQRLLGALALDELRRARPVPLGIALPQDKRLRALCEAVLAAPARHHRLEECAAAVGASPRTVARLFRQQLGTSFGPWRQQVLLARALVFAAEGRPVAWIAAELGYASASAFTAMVRKSVGAPPSRFFRSAL